MKPVHWSERLGALIDWRFLVALGVLACNDHWLKYAYPGFVTGKLSDFAGLYAFGFFWVALWPQRRILILTAIAVGFIWWKSPMSNLLIHVWSQIFYPLQRTIDYSDYLAIPVLLSVPSRFVYLSSSILIRSALFSLTWLAFAATSRIETRLMRLVYHGSPKEAVSLLDSLSQNRIANMDVGKPDNEAEKFLDEYIFRLRSKTNDTLFLFQVRDGLDSYPVSFSIQLQSMYEVKTNKLHVFGYQAYGDEANVMKNAQFKFGERFKEIEPYFFRKGYTFVTARFVHPPNGARY